jgi:hypothetical protein
MVSWSPAPYFIRMMKPSMDSLALKKKPGQTASFNNCREFFLDLRIVRSSFMRAFNIAKFFSASSLNEDIGAKFHWKDWV